MSELDHVASTRDVYGHSTVEYLRRVGTNISPDFERPIDRSVLSAFAEDIVSCGGGPVVDIGCGPGRATAYLAERGVDICGVDITPNMVEAARAAHPELRFKMGSSTSLPQPDSSVVGAVFWYSIIHTPLDDLDAVWNELSRVLVAPGLVLIGFQAGENDHVQLPNAYGSPATLSSYRHSSSDVIESLSRAGFELHSNVWRTAQLSHETTPQVFLIVTKRC